MKAQKGLVLQLEFPHVLFCTKTMYTALNIIVAVFTLPRQKMQSQDKNLS